MTQLITALSSARDSREAGEELGKAIRREFGGADAHALIVFASARHDFSVLLPTLAAEVGTEVIAGATSAGEFHGPSFVEGGVSVLAIRSEDMQFAVGLGHGVGAAPGKAAEEVAGALGVPQAGRFPYRVALVMTDALAGQADTMVERLTVQTQGNCRFFGGGAGDDARFEQTHVIAGCEAHRDAVVALQILSNKPIGIGVSHGWIPASEPLRVTEVQGATLVGINGLPAIDSFEEHAASTGQRLDRDSPLSFFLHNVIGIDTPRGFKLRVPLGVGEDGSVVCAAEVPEGAIIRIMRTTAQSAAQAAARASEAALAGLEGRTPGAGLVFDCVATRLRLGAEFGDELQACSDLLKPAKFIGCNTYGQIARAEGQFEGFHNCTAVVCVFPK